MTEVTFSFDLHVLSMPQAFVLSQDQTLQFEKLLYLSSHDPVPNMSP